MKDEELLYKLGLTYKTSTAAYVYTEEVTDQLDIERVIQGEAACFRDYQPASQEHYEKKIIIFCDPSVRYGLSFPGSFNPGPLSELVDLVAKLDELGFKLYVCLNKNNIVPVDICRVPEQFKEVEPIHQDDVNELASCNGWSCDQCFMAGFQGSRLVHRALIKNDSIADINDPSTLRLSELDNLNERELGLLLDSFSEKPSITLAVSKDSPLINSELIMGWVALHQHVLIFPGSEEEHLLSSDIERLIPGDTAKYGKEKHKWLSALRLMNYFIDKNLLSKLEKYERLERLKIDDCELSADIVNNFSTFPSLKTLRLEFPEANDEALSHLLARFPNVNEISISFEESTEFDHTAIALFPLRHKLKKLELTNCEMGEVTASLLLGQSSNLEKLILSDAAFEVDQLPQKLLKLRHLELRNCEIDASSMFCLLNSFDALETLILSQIELEPDPLPQQLPKNLSELKHLELEDCEMDVSTVSALLNGATGLKELSVQHMNLEHGSLPQFWQLETLSLAPPRESAAALLTKCRATIKKLTLSLLNLEDLVNDLDDPIPLKQLDTLRLYNNTLLAFSRLDSKARALFPALKKLKFPNSCFNVEDLSKRHIRSLLHWQPLTIEVRFITGPVPAELAERHQFVEREPSLARFYIRRERFTTSFSQDYQLSSQLASYPLDSFTSLPSSVDAEAYFYANAGFCIGRERFTTSFSQDYQLPSQLASYPLDSFTSLPSSVDAEAYFYAKPEGMQTISPTEYRMEIYSRVGNICQGENVKLLSVSDRQLKPVVSVVESDSYAALKKQHDTALLNK